VVPVPPENQSTYLYVDIAAGSDSNAGSQSAPLKTIAAAMGKALANNDRGIGTKVLINPGVYREFVNIHSTSRQTNATITFEAVKAGTAIIAGSDAISGWQAIGATEYVHSWNDPLIGCSAPSSWPVLPSITLRSEMVFIDGTPLTQILDSADQRAGTFLVDTQSNQIHIWPPTGTDMNTALVEVSARPQILTVVGRRDVVLRGLVFRHAGNCLNTSAVNVYNSDVVLFDQVQANWNNWGGILVSSSNNVTVQNSVASYNGGVGFSSNKVTNILLKIETDYNNWRGAMGAFYDFGMGGTKLLLAHGVHVIQHVAYRNHAQGLWFDTDNKDISISNGILSENLLANLKLEGNQGPVGVQNNSLCSGGMGMLVVNTANLTATGNNFYNNGGTAKWQAQLFLAGNPAGGRPVTDWQTGQFYRISTSNTVLANNVFTDAGIGQYVFSTYLSGADWTAFSGSLHSGQNKWTDSQSTKAFMVPGGHVETLNGWQNVTGQDQDSAWELSQDAAKNCAVPAASFPDFNVYANNRVNASVPVWSQPYAMSGGVATINLQVKSFDFGPVTLSTSALPSGVSASFSPSTLTSGNSVLTLHAASNAATETIHLTVFGTSGNRVHSVTVLVAVAP
jgi:hypothetical protein